MFYHYRALHSKHWARTAGILWALAAVLTWLWLSPGISGTFVLLVLGMSVVMLAAGWSGIRARKRPRKGRHVQHARKH